MPTQLTISGIKFRSYGRSFNISLGSNFYMCMFSFLTKSRVAQSGTGDYLMAPAPKYQLPIWLAFVMLE